VLRAFSAVLLRLDHGGHRDLSRRANAFQQRSSAGLDSCIDDACQSAALSLSRAGRAQTLSASTGKRHAVSSTAVRRCGCDERLFRFVSGIGVDVGGVRDALARWQNARLAVCDRTGRHAGDP